MKTHEEVVDYIRQHPEEIMGLLEDTANSFEDTGDCGTVSTNQINKVRAVVGWEPLDTSESIEADEDEDEPV